MPVKKTKTRTSKTLTTTDYESDSSVNTSGIDAMTDFEIKECAVCFNDSKLVNFPVREDKQCTHKFCDKCIEQVDRCPMCRAVKRGNKWTMKELYHHAMSTPIHKMNLSFDEWIKK